MLKRLQIDDDGNGSAERLAGRLDVARADALSLPFSAVARMVPHSGIQFIDLELPTDRLAIVQHRFIVETAPPGTDLPDALVPLPPTSDGDGLEWHPITRAPLKPEETRWLTGFDGVEAFLGKWVPLPYFRFVGRAGDGEKMRFDHGPTNWARLFIAPPTSDLRTVQRLKAVVAFDTRLAADDAMPDQDRTYLAPSNDDARFGSTFLLNDEPEDLGVFLGEAWVDQWLSGIVAKMPTMGARPKLDHIARYLALLRVLKSARVLPEVRLIDTFSTRFPVTTDAVDLVLDIGDDATTAMLVESNADRSEGRQLSRGREVAIRHLSRPTLITDGQISTVVEFDEAPFGDALASRRSGRADAFLWPSLVRIGAEAQALQSRDLATPGVTGLANLRSKLAETDAHTGLWRVARDGPLTALTGGTLGPAASGPLLSFITEDGRSIGRLLSGPDKQKTAPPALRPRFSNSSILTHFLTEVLLQVLAGLNAPLGTERTNSAIHCRRLERVMVTVPAGASDEERALLHERATDAVDLVWRAMGWQDATHGLAFNQKPAVLLGLGADLAAQVVFVHDAIRQHFGSDAAQFVEFTRRPRHAHRLTPDLKIATVDGADDRTHITVVDYTLPPDGSTQEGVLAPRLASAKIEPSGLKVLTDAVIAAVIEPAIAAHLSQAGVDDGARFLADVTGPWHLAAPINDAHFASRFRARVLMPSARALITTYARRTRQSGQGDGIPFDLRLDALVALDAQAHQSKGRVAPRLGATTLAMMFDAAAERKGALSFRLAEVPLRLRWLDLARALSTPLDDLIARIVSALNAESPDVVLLNGSLMAIPDAVDKLGAALDLMPARLIEMSKMRFALVDQFGVEWRRPGAAATLRPWLTGAIGAFIASRPEAADQHATAETVAPSRRLTDASASTRGQS